MANLKTVLDKLFPYGNAWMYPLIFVWSISMTIILMVIPSLLAIAYDVMAAKYGDFDLSIMSTISPLLNPATKIFLLFTIISVFVDTYLYLKSHLTKKAVIEHG